MPNVWTHLIFGQKVLDTIGQSHLLTGTTTNLFNLGCQGPDFLFYHNFWPWKKDKRLNELGEIIHHEKCGPLLLEMIRQMRGRPLQDPAVIYLLGFLTHHVLDRNLHPYIHYKAGYKKWDHQRLEVILDTIMVRHFLGLETWRTAVWKRIDIGKDFPPGVAEMFQRVTNKIFPEVATHVRPGDWGDAYRDMVRAQRIFYDPTGLKRILTFGKIEPLVYKRSIPTRDYLNEAKAVWRHPAVFEETSTDSVWDLWEKALIDGVEVLRETVKYLEQASAATAAGKSGAANETPLIEKIGNVSYDTGKSCNSRLKLQYADPIL